LSKPLLSRRWESLESVRLIGMLGKGRWVCLTLGGSQYGDCKADYKNSPVLVLFVLWAGVGGLPA
jgi:hypothetical protein